MHFAALNFSSKPLPYGQTDRISRRSTFFEKYRFFNFAALSRARHDADRREIRGKCSTNKYLSNAIEIVSNDARAVTIPNSASKFGFF